MKIKINSVIKVQQNGTSFYVGKLRLSDLMKSAVVFTREIPYDKKKYNALNYVEEIIEKESISEEEAAFGTQRRENNARLKEIGQFIEKKNGFFPNSLIVSIDPRSKENESLKDTAIRNLEEVITINEKENYIEFDNEEAEIKLIDGQHRFYGFYYVDKEKLKKMEDSFEFILTIFINLPFSEQADLFATINSTQKPVSKSLLADLKGTQFKKYRRVHVANAITKWLNERDDEKRDLILWKNKIKMLGKGEGIISQGMFVEGLSRLISNDKETTKGVLYELYEQKKYDEIYFILKDYFTAYEMTFKKEWANPNYLLCKTVGFVAMCRSFEILYVDYNLKKMSNFESFVFDKLKKFKENNRYSLEFFSKTRFGSSLTDANKMSDIILGTIYQHHELEQIKSATKTYYKIKI